MATKRANRIDPNAAFNAIVGITPPAEVQEAPIEAPAGAGEGSAAPAAPAMRAETEQPVLQTTPPAPAAPASAPKKLVQKGYYLTEEQVRQLGITAVMKGVDRSSIVRDALDLYFESQKEQAL